MKHIAQVSWSRQGIDLFVEGKYSRKHLWTFDGGSTLVASSSPFVVPLPYSLEKAADPEEAFIACLSSCHMLFFLSIAASKKWIVDAYLDQAEGILEKDQEGRLMMNSVLLKPKVTFSAHSLPTAYQIDQLHQQAHGQCFLANSVKTQIRILPQ